MGNVLEFPLRHVCALGVPPEIISQVRRALSNISVSVDASSLKRADLLVIGEDEPRAFVGAPAFPILVWTADTLASELAERCRMLLS